MTAFGEWDDLDEKAPAPVEPHGSPGVDDDPAVVEADDLLADAEGDLRVAEARLEDALDDDDLAAAERVAAQEAVARAERARDRAAARLARARQAAQAAPPAGGEDEAPASTYFGSVDEWMRVWMLPTYRRIIKGPQGGVVWRADWWRSAEAVSRLEALWRAWEHLRLDPGTGMSAWWRDHADHHMEVLLSPDGPFKGLATVSSNRAGEQLPYERPPEGFFPPDFH